MNVQIGYTVRVWKWVYDREYADEGKVQVVKTDKIGRTLVMVNGDWYEATNDEANRCEIISTTDPQTRTRKGMTNGQLAAKYGISLETLRDYFLDFVENEGYTSDGEEHETFVDYLSYVTRYHHPRNIDQYDGGRGAGSLGRPID
jgi:hypothetical protein